MLIMKKKIYCYITKYKKVGVLPIQIVWSNVSSIGPSSERNWFLSDEGPMLETLDHTIRVGSTPTFLYFDLYLYSAYTAHYVYFNIVTYLYIRRI